MEIVVNTRTNEKKLQSKRLRREGQIPSVIYAKGSPTDLISVPQREFETFLRSVKMGHLYTTPISLKNSEGKEIRVLVKQLQYHPTTDEILHIDFVELKKGETVRVDVPIECIGMADCKGITQGGVFRQSLRFVKVTCPTDKVPQEFVLDIRHLEVQQHISLEAIQIPEGVTLMVHPSVVVAAVAKR